MLLSKSISKTFYLPLTVEWKKNSPKKRKKNKNTKRCRRPATMRQQNESKSFFSLLVVEKIYFCVSNFGCLDILFESERGEWERFKRAKNSKIITETKKKLFPSSLQTSINYGSNSKFNFSVEREESQTFSTFFPPVDVDHAIFHPRKFQPCCMKYI